MALAACLALILAASLSGCGSSSSGDEPATQRLRLPGRDAVNSREAEGTIDSSNVAELKQAWSLPLTAQAPTAPTPPRR